MLLKYFYDRALAHASYLVGCQSTGEAIVIDPSRSVEDYLETATRHGMRIVGAAETHIHADFVSGAHELADRVGATLYLSNEGNADWKYEFVGSYTSQLLKNDDVFYVGKVKLRVMHTPGHTPESISFILTDEGGGASAPMGIFTGDFVFVGSIGRPDLLETAVGVEGSAAAGARQLYQSARKFHQLPDYLQVWPAHGAGSACGKGLGAVPSSTVGYEKLFNPALQFSDEQSFVNYILADQPETPLYFAVMKRVNKTGPKLIRNLPDVQAIAPIELPHVVATHLVIDTLASKDFGEAHCPGTMNIPEAMLVQWAGFFVNYDQPVYLITDATALEGNLRSLRSIGIDNVGGYFDAKAVRDAGLRKETYASASVQQLHSQIDADAVRLIDVRAASEFQQGHIAKAEHQFLGRLLRDLDQLDRTKPIVTQCLGGGRSAIAASILQRAGFDVTNMHGGYKAWKAAGFPIASQ